MAYTAGASYGSSTALAGPSTFNPANHSTGVSQPPQQPGAPYWANSAAPRMSPAPATAPMTPVSATFPAQPTQAQITPAMAPEMLARLAKNLTPEQMAALKAKPAAEAMAILQSMSTRARTASATPTSAGPSINAAPTSAAEQATLFHKNLHNFNTSRGQPSPFPAVFDGRPINLFQVFYIVLQRGGSVQIQQQGLWGEVLRLLGLPPDDTKTDPPSYSVAKCQAMAQYFSETIGAYEAVFRQDNLRKLAARQAAQQSTSSAAAATPVVAHAPIAPTSAAATPAPAPASPGKRKAEAAIIKPPGASAEPKRRKKQKVEYVAYTRPLDSLGGWVLDTIETSHRDATNLRRARAAADLGNVDIYSLVMSMRSRIPSEVTYALNSLNLIFQGAIANQVPFRLKEAEGILDELVELFEETAFGESGASERSPSPPSATSGRRAKRAPARPTSYRAHVLAVIEQEGDLNWTAATRKTVSPLPRADVVLAVLALLRLLSTVTENHNQLCQHPTLLFTILHACAFGDRAGDDMAFLTLRDLLEVRKDVCHIICDLGSRCHFHASPAVCAAAIFRLFSFFILDSPDSSMLADYGDAALSGFARVFLIDVNRDALSSAHVAPLDLYEHLVRLLPLSEPDYAAVFSSEQAYVRTLMLAMSVFNLVYVASPGQRARYRASPGAALCLVRLVRRLLLIGTQQPSRRGDCEMLVTRFLASLTLLNGGDEAAAAPAQDDGGGEGGSGVVDDRGPWFGVRSGGGPRSAIVVTDEAPTTAEAGELARADAPTSAAASSGTLPLFAAQGRAGFMATFSGCAMDEATTATILALYERGAGKSGV